MSVPLSDWFVIGLCWRGKPAATDDELSEVADEVAIDVVGVWLVLNEGAVEVDLGDANLPELAHEDLCLIREMLPPGGIPARDFRIGRPHDEDGLTQFVEGHIVRSRRQQPALIEVWDHVVRAFLRRYRA